MTHTHTHREREREREREIYIYIYITRPSTQMRFERRHSYPKRFGADVLTEDICIDVGIAGATTLQSLISSPAISPTRKKPAKRTAQKLEKRNLPEGSTQQSLPCLYPDNDSPSMVRPRAAHAAVKAMLDANVPNILFADPP